MARISCRAIKLAVLLAIVSPFGAAEEAFSQPNEDASIEMSEGTSELEAEAEMLAAFYNVTEEAMVELAEVAAGEPTSTPGLRGAAAVGWGRGILGETCCMCSRSLGEVTYLFAAGDYRRRFGAQSAYMYCNSVCETQCLKKGGHEFGCYDEAHLAQMDRLYGDNPEYNILHESRFGSIC